MSAETATRNNAAGRAAAAGPVALELSGITKRYRNATVVDALDLTLAEGDFLALVGPSGCGKTTTLRMIAGLAMPDAGTLHIRGRDRTYSAPHKRDTTLVFQSYALFPHRTVAQNVEYGLRRRKVPKAERATRVAEALALVNLPDVGDRYPRQLSGGQQQRIALARALVVKPTLLLLDEPLSNLDAGLRDQMRAELRRIHRDTGTTTLLVTHDQDEALSVASKVAVMNRGRIEQLSAPRELYTRPHSDFVATFVGKTNLFEASDEQGTGVLRVADRPVALAHDRRSATVALRPEQIRVLGAGPDAAPSADEAVFDGTVAEVLYTGPTSLVSIRVPALGRSLSVTYPENRGATAELAVGAPVRVAWRLDAPLAFAGADA